MNSFFTRFYLTNTVKLVTISNKWMIFEIFGGVTASTGAWTLESMLSVVCVLIKQAVKQ